MKIEIGFEIENAPAVSVNADLFDVWDVGPWKVELAIFPAGERPENGEIFAESLTWREACRMVEEIESGFEKARITDSLGHSIVLEGFMADVWEFVLTQTEIIGRIKVEFWNSYLKTWQTLAGSFFIDERNH